MEQSRTIGNEQGSTRNEYWRIRFTGTAGTSVIARRKESVYNDAVERLEVKRGFSLVKRCYGLDCIRTKLETTTKSSISLSILAMNVGKLMAVSLCEYLKSIVQGLWVGI